MDPKLLEILVCPLCKGPLAWNKAALELICKGDRLAFPVKNDITKVVPIVKNPSPWMK